MNFPQDAIKTIIAYLIGGGGTAGDVIKAVLEVLDYARWLWFESGLVTIKTAAPKGISDVAAANALQTLVDEHAAGVQAQSFTLPPWLIPVLIELLKRLWK